MRTIVYSRVSTDAQAEDGTSLDTQERACREYAEEAGGTVIRTIRDTASGSSLERPGMAELRRAMRDGECEVVLAYALDRLSRDQNHIGVVFADAEDADVRLEFVTEDFEDTAIGKFIIAARGFVSEVEREKIAERTMRGKAERARNGRLPQGTGAGCYGYIYVPETGLRDVNPAQAAIVLRIFEEFVAGKACSRIATELNADGIPTLTGKRWFPITVTRVLKNETYTGRTVYRRTKVEMVRQPGGRGRKRRVVKRDPSEQIEIEGATPRIVSPELYRRAQQRFDDPERRAQRAPSRKYPLRGRLRCRHCGAGMVGQAVNGGRYLYYRCNRLYLSDKDKRCKGRQVPKEALESAVREGIEEVLANPELAIGMAERLRDGAEHAARLTELERELKGLDESQDRLVDLYTDGRIAKDALDRKQDELSRRRGALERERAQLRSEMEPSCDPALLRERMPEVLAFIREWVGKADGDDLVLLVQALDAHIDVSLEEADIRVEVPMIEGVGGKNFATTEQTSA